MSTWSSKSVSEQFAVTASFSPAVFFSGCNGISLPSDLKKDYFFVIARFVMKTAIRSTSRKVANFVQSLDIAELGLEFISKYFPSDWNLG